MSAATAASPAIHAIHQRAWALMAGLAACGLLGALAMVMRQAVRQGDASHRATALQAESDWRCRTLKPRMQRERCLALAAERRPATSAGVLALVAEAGAGPVR